MSPEYRFIFQMPFDYWTGIQKVAPLKGGQVNVWYSDVFQCSDVSGIRISTVLPSFVVFKFPLKDKKEPFKRLAS